MVVLVAALLRQLGVAAEQEGMRALFRDASFRLQRSAGRGLGACQEATDTQKTWCSTAHPPALVLGASSASGSDVNTPSLHDVQPRPRVPAAFPSEESR